MTSVVAMLIASAICIRLNDQVMRHVTLDNICNIKLELAAEKKLRWRKETLFAAHKLLFLFIR